MVGSSLSTKFKVIGWKRCLPEILGKEGHGICFPWDGLKDCAMHSEYLEFYIIAIAFYFSGTRWSWLTLRRCRRNEQSLRLRWRSLGLWEADWLNEQRSLLRCWPRSKLRIQSWELRMRRCTNLCWKAVSSVQLQINLFYSLDQN